MQIVDVCLNLLHIFIDGLAPLVNGQKSLSEKGVSAHQAVEVDATVFDGEGLVVEEQLLFSVEQDALGIDFVDPLAECVLFLLQSPACCGTFCPAEGVGGVPVADAEDSEVPIACDPELVRVDGGVQLCEDQFRHANAHRHIRNAFNLSALLVHHDVVNLGLHVFFTGAHGAARRRHPRQ